jgi:hypothetical protein
MLPLGCIPHRVREGVTITAITKENRIYNKTRISPEQKKQKIP